MKTSQPPCYCIALLHTTSFSKALTWFLLMPFKPLSSPHIYHRYGDEIFFPCLFTYWFLLVCRTAAVFLSQSFSRLRIPVPSSSHFCGSLGIQAAVLQTFYSWCREDMFLDSASHLVWDLTGTGRNTPFAMQAVCLFEHPYLLLFCPSPWEHGIAHSCSEIRPIILTPKFKNIV